MKWTETFIYLKSNAWIIVAQFIYYNFQLWHAWKFLDGKFNNLKKLNLMKLKNIWYEKHTKGRLIIKDGD